MPEPTTATMIHANTSTTKVRSAVAISESVSERPHLAKIEVMPAKNAEATAAITQDTQTNTSFGKIGTGCVPHSEGASSHRITSGSHCRKCSDQENEKTVPVPIPPPDNPASLTQRGGIGSTYLNVSIEESQQRTSGKHDIACAGGFVRRVHGKLGTAHINAMHTCLYVGQVAQG